MKRYFVIKKKNESKFNEVSNLILETIHKYEYLNGTIDKYAFQTIDKDRDEKIIRELNKIANDVSDEKYKEQYAKFRELSQYSKDSLTIKEGKYLKTIYHEKKEDTTNDFSADKEKISISKSALISLIPIDKYVKLSKECDKYFSSAYYGDGDDWWEGYTETLTLYGVMDDANWHKNNSCPLLVYVRVIDQLFFYISGLEEFASSYMKHILSILKHCYY